MEFSKDLKNKKLYIKREFKAPPEDVWNAWTDSGILDQWWAPKPWKAVTKKMDFREGGLWLYAMKGPDGTEHLARVGYEKIEPIKRFTAVDSFSDENGNINTDLPVMHWDCTFNKSVNGTEVTVEITFEKESDIEKIIEMGFKEGFTSALENLDEVFAVSLN